MRRRRAGGLLVSSGGAVVAVALAGLLAGPAGAGTSGSVVQVSADPYANAGPQHATEVEPDTVAVGHSLVSVFQVGRWDNGCSDDIGWATSHNGGATWAHGFLPGLTAFSRPRGPFFRASDPSVAYDARFGDWLASSLACIGKSPNPGLFIHSPAVEVNLSFNGTSWTHEITAARIKKGQDFDKEWVTCDNSTTSRFYGNCYMEWDLDNQGERVLMTTSTDGGRTWSPDETTVTGLHATGGEPVVEPDGTVVVPIVSSSGIVDFRSVNGGKTWGPPTKVASIFQHFPAGNLRGPSFPSVTVNDAGTIYITWPDCRFRPACASNDMVMTSSSNDGTSWTPVRRIPIDPVTSTADHLGGGLGVDPTTSGSSARLGLFYYFYPKAACTVATCRLEVGYISSADGGARWSRAHLIAGPMKLTELPFAGGFMVGDYVGAAVVPGGNAFAAFAVGGIPSATQQFSEPMYEPFRGETITGGSAPAASAGVQPGLREASMPGITH